MLYFSHCSFKVLNIFRWRNDAELAEFAWRQPFPQLNQPVSVNMLLTEQSRPEWNPHRRDASPLRTIAACNTSDEAQSSQQSDDLSLMDCEAIDVYWRHDIEQEKGFMIPSMLAPGTSPVDTATEQFERDLQLLTEKSLLAVSFITHNSFIHTRKQFKDVICTQNIEVTVLGRHSQTMFLSCLGHSAYRH
jgi:hypothetical protein